MTIPTRKSVIQALAVAGAYFITGRVGLMLPAFGATVTLLWLPTGIAVAALLRWGNGCWPGVWLGAFTVNLAIGTPWAAAAGVATGNTLGPLLAVWTLRRMGFHEAFDRARDILLLAAAAALGMTVTASVGVATMSAAGRLPSGHGLAWLAWWAGDVMGVISAAPLLLTFTRREAGAILDRRTEFAIWLAATGLTTWGVFILSPSVGHQALSLAFVPLPFVAWAALRFGAVGTSLALIVLSAGAVYGTATSRGPFYRPDAFAQVGTLWLFMATSAALGWLISALQAARLQATGIQRLFEQALSDVSLGVLLTGLDRRITYANQGFTRLTGYSAAEMLGKNCAVLQGPDTDPETVARLQVALHGEGSFDGEILNYRKDGTSFWNGLLISPVRDERGARTGFLGIQRDITKRKKAELALNESEEHLRMIVELEPECVKIISPSGTLVEMNPAGLAMIEADSLDQVRDHSLGELIVPENRAAFAEMHQRVLRGAAGHCEFAIIGLKGTRRWLETHAVPYRNARNEIVGVLGITRDNTERNEAAAERERSLATLQLFIDTVPAYIALIDADERYQLVNRHYEEYYRQPTTQIVGQRLRDVQPPAVYAETAPRVRAALAGQPVRYQSHATGPDGRSYWFDVQYVPRRSAHGVVTGFFVLVFDITENKQAEAALRQSEESFRTLTAHLPDVVVRLDEQGRHLYANPAVLDATGLPPEAFIGKTNEELGMPAENTAVWKVTLDQLFATGNDARLEFAYTGPRGERYWESRVVAERGADGTIESALVLSRDITQLRQAELAQQEALGRLQKIASQLPGVVYQFRMRPDGSSCFPFASEAIREIYRTTPEEVREEASKVFAILHPDDYDGIVASIQESARTLTPWRYEYRVKFPDGTVRWLFGNSLPQREADGSTLWHGFITDITQRKQAQIEREQLDRKMQETQKLESLGVLAGGIAHDFNNLLTSVLGNASIAALDLPPGSPTQDCITQITEASLRAADLCKQMLAYSGRGRFIVQTLDLGQLVEQTAQMLQISISKKAVLRFRMERDLPPIEVDATQIRQVIMNLVINASEAIGEQSGVISLSTGLTRVDRTYLAGTLMDANLAEGEYVFLEVSDNGSGMSPETQAKIFDPFFTTKFTGRGLGLAAVLGIVRGHKGALKVYSEVGRGTTFKLLFPAARGVSETATTAVASGQNWRGHGTVLVADDEETLRSTIARMLSLFGLEPVLVSDGREAVEVFRADPSRFALVLLDLTMPHMDGEQAFTELRRLRPDVKVVLMSGFNAQEAMVRFTGKGLASFVQKPFTVGALRTVLQGVLG